MKLKTSHTRMLLTCMLILACVIFTSSCGKKGDPAPRSKSKSFSLNNLKAEPIGNCIQITADLTGNMENLNEIRLELSPLNGPEDCPGCPFLPSDIKYFSQKEAHFNPEKGSISLSYCPKPAPAYRWRIFATNQYDKISHTSSQVRLLVMPTKE